MPGPERFSPVAPLPPLGPWRRVLAVDRGAGEPHPVSLSHPPPAVLDDPARLAQVVRDVEAAGRLHHPSAVAVLGLETLDEAPVVVEEAARGPTLRELLDGAGRLPADIAARIALDVAAAVARAHALDAGDGKPLVHGAIGPAAIVLADDGAARLAGFGAYGGGSPEDDVRALGAVLHECLGGEPPATPPRRIDAPGIPAALAAAVDAATGASGASCPASAAAFALAVAGASGVASHPDVAAYVDAIAPSGEGARGDRERALSAALAPDVPEVSAELIAPPSSARRGLAAPQVTASSVHLERSGAAGSAESRGAESKAAQPAVADATPEPLPRPPATRPGVDPAGVFAAPRPMARRSRAPLVVAVVCLAAGFAGGFAAARTWLAPGPESAPVAPAPSAPPRIAAPAAAEPAALEAPPAPEPARPPPPERRDPKTDRRKPPPAPKPPSGKASRPAAPFAASGMLDVKAPADADVFLDGIRIGKGGLRREIPAGAHRIEVRLGEASAGEGFDVAPGETWTYEVTPTP